MNLVMLIGSGEDWSIESDLVFRKIDRYLFDVALNEADHGFNASAELSVT